MKKLIGLSVAFVFVSALAAWGRAQERSQVNKDRNLPDQHRRELEPEPADPLIPPNRRWGPRNLPRGTFLPDLAARISGPKTANAGANIGEELRVEIENIGERVARRGLTMEVWLQGDPDLPRRPALLKRIVIPSGLSPMESRSLDVYGATVPTDARAGFAYLCVRADPENSIAEEDETNNVACTRIQINKGENSPGRAYPARPARLILSSAADPKK